MPNDITPFGASEIMMDLQPAFGPHEPVAVEERGQAYLKEALRQAAEARWEAACPPAIKETDWAHAGLAPYACSIQRILAHQTGAKGILASGPTGRGKTRSMWQLMRRMACSEGRDVRYYHAAEWFTELQSKISYGRDDANGWIEAVARRQIVFIDDLGQESLTKAREDWAQGWFFRFLDIRVGEKLPLYITTNLSAEDIAPKTAKSSLRADPLLRRLLDLCEPISFK